MTEVSPREAYRLWSASYDRGLNPVIALEQRLLGPRLRIGAGSTVLDLATGTGRWLEYAVSREARGIGFDISTEMLTVAAGKTGLRGRLAVADISQLPVRDNAAQFAICSFALGYIAAPRKAFREMARVANRVIVSDLHPDAIQAGWNRSFRAGDTRYEISHHLHSLHTLHAAAREAGLKPEWVIEARFDEPEHAIFERAGRVSVFEAVREVKAVLIWAWVQS